ncbi:Spindle pole body component alp6 [Cyphellophora attinorum]|uniref:Spindle pole body component alp6 n=1 Tax=Cyphellophora attinorum TaxID=1664694 RepID=A0A0N1NYR2_9EURO|nr:Spindle pole body component alp6 [Phialophora attinorum]KPI37430.1 Spindle pole body component alp6 [Phialophora attinorum]
MGSRVDDTLQSLFESIVAPPLPGEGHEDAEDRIEQSIQWAKEIVEAGQHKPCDDANNAPQAIKRKLLRENDSPKPASRFDDLYKRLLVIPVLNQKWKILHLLRLLADADRHYVEQQQPDEPEPDLTPSPLAQRQSMRPNSSRLPQRDARPSTAGTEVNHSGQADTDPAHHHTSPFASRPKSSGRNEPPPRSAGKDSVPPPKPRAQSGPTEMDLLRDLPFNLQGLSSTNVSLASPGKAQLPSTLPVPILSLLYTLAEPCLLYRELADFTSGQGGSLINQSLRAAISQELRAYLSLVATLEGEVRRALALLDQGDSLKSVRSAGVTLKRCVIWTKDATMGLRLMSLFVEEAKRRKGGLIISLIHDLSSTHGDPFVGAFASRMLAQVARPFYEMLRHWIYDGELVDPYLEFFVIEPDPSEKPDVDPRRVATSIWEDKYSLDSGMVPSIVSAEFAKKVFLIGKSLNFIRNNCGDSDWVIQYSKSNSKSLDHANTATLFSSIDAAYASTMSRLTYLMSSKFGLFTHLAAIKKYLLLAQGDFIDLLMESLAPNLDRPANSQYRHTLTSQLEHAIRHSNAQYDDPEVLRRLDARMLELSSGEIGWDCFTLEYKSSAPCDVVITQWANTQYLKIFNLLWRIKRVDVLSAVNDKLGEDWKRARCVIAEMVHFVNQLLYYILFEVIEASWTILQTELHKPNSTLDDLIEAHTKYINNITRKGLLGQQRHVSTGQREDSPLAQLHYILKAMLSYRDVVDSLYSYSVAEFTKRQQFSAKIEQRTAAGKWGITEKDLAGDSRASTPSLYPPQAAKVGSKLAEFVDSTNSPLLQPITIGSAADDHALLESLRARLLQVSADFRSRVNMLLYDLAHQPDADLRFLGVVMNFNEVYKPVNQRRAKRREQERERRGKDGGGSSEATGVGTADANAITSQPESRKVSEAVSSVR